MKKEIQYKGGKFRKEKVGLQMLHKWVISVKGRPPFCEFCGHPNKPEGRSRIEWANKSHKYKRKLDDWLALCRKCHMDYDKIDRSTIQKKVWQNPQYRQHMSDVHKGKPGYWKGKKRPNLSRKTK